MSAGGIFSRRNFDADAGSNFSRRNLGMSAGDIFSCKIFDAGDFCKRGICRDVE